MNEYDIDRFSELILIISLMTMLFSWGLLVIVGGVFFSVEIMIAVYSIGSVGLVLLWIVSKFKAQYVAAVEILLTEAGKYAPPAVEIPVLPAEKVFQAVCSRSLRWSVQQYRNYDDFLYGSFDAYVTKEEIMVRGRLKRGPQSPYMKINGPFRR